MRLCDDHLGCAWGAHLFRTRKILALQSAPRHAAWGSASSRVRGVEIIKLGVSIYRARLLVSGGVAANRELRKTFEQRAAEEGLSVLFPSRKLSTDNAAMIAAAAYPRFLAGEFAAADLSSDAALRLG